MIEKMEDIVIREIILDNKKVYQYTIQPAEIKNVLGAVAAILNEYCFTENSKELFKLFRTKEGNWYEFGDDIPSGYTSLIGAIKSAIEKEEMTQLPNVA